jgi:hypothetical protein
MIEQDAGKDIRDPSGKRQIEGNQADRPVQNLNIKSLEYGRETLARRSWSLKTLIGPIETCSLFCLIVLSYSARSFPKASRRA